MSLAKILAVAAIATSALATNAVAGGFAAVITEPPLVTIVEPAPPARSSWGIILPLVGVGLLIALAAANEEDESE